MYPVLFKIPLFGGITIHTYGLMVAFGFLVALFYVTRESRRVGENPALAMDLAFYVILAAIIGSRILHVAISERERFFQNPLIFFKIWEGGLVFYGGLIAALAVSIWFIRRHKMNALKTCDIFAPAIALGHAIGRIGCTFAGCCYGRMLDHATWFSITFPPNPKSFAPTGVPLYPTQPMEVVGELLNFAILVVLSRYKRFEGQLIGTYLILYAILRFVVEFYRGDAERGFLFGGLLSTSQTISVILFVIGVLFYVKLWRKGEGLK